jgi:hypothetical protein
MTAIAEAGLAGDEPIEPIDLEGVPPTFAALGRSGDGVLLGASPLGGGEALFSVLALARSRPDFRGRALAIAPSWSIEARRRLRVSVPRAFELQGIAAPQVFDGALHVQPADAPPPLPVAPELVGAGLSRPEDREVFRRALAGLEGLAAKHGGSIRGVSDRVELLLLTRPVASLRIGSAGARLDLSGADRASLPLDGEGLAAALDRLEGSLRKQLNDRRARGSEDGLRASLLPVFERVGDLRRTRVWPLVGGEPCPLDLVGTDGDGRLLVAAARERLDLRSVGEILDAALDPRASFSLLLGGDVAPRIDEHGPRLLIAAREFDPAALQVLSLLSLEVRAYDVTPGRGELGLSPRELPASAGGGAEGQPIRSPATAAEAPATPDAEASSDSGAAETAGREREPRERGRGRARGRGRREAGKPAELPEAAESSEPAAAGGERPSGFDEVSLFDLEDESPTDSGEAPRRRRRSRGGRRRGRRSQGRSGEGSEGEGEGEGEGGDREDQAPARTRGEAPRESPPSVVRESDDGEELVDDDEDIVQLADDAPDLEDSVDLRYEDQESEEEGDQEADRARAQRELRRRARAAKAEPEPPKPPRRRAAFVAHADRMSVLTAVLLARDVRLVESFWVYPQEDLMTFFRSVATDLREETPIFLVGFTASPPARDTLQAASLYRGRLHWFDHHPWPPEDLVALKEAIGDDAVHIVPGGESSLATVIAERTRRSRFSDKLVELATGRFTQHDFERWGRVWWHRAGEIARKRGDRRADIDPLLAGRPSDLAKEASRIEPPPPPLEVAFVSERDFRLVHFGGFVMVVLEVPEALDIHLAGRIARERYGAQLSLASREGADLLVLGGDDSRTRRGLDLGGMAAHLASKHEWITALPDDDFVARLHVSDLHSVPGRLDEVISEIAMGRSIVEG